MENLIVDNSKRLRFIELIRGRCDDTNNTREDKDVFLCRTCCSRHAMYDRRKEGLFKIEFEGHEMVSLCSKTYVAKNETSGEVKVSTKGCNKRLLTNPLSDCRRALQEKCTVHVQNRGIRLKDSILQTYFQNKIGFNFFYCKRVVQPDLICTKPLDITISPHPLFTCCICQSEAAEVKMADDNQRVCFDCLLL